MATPLSSPITVPATCLATATARHCQWRDPVLFNTTSCALAATRNELAAAEEQWLALEMRREEIEGV